MDQLTVKFMPQNKSIRVPKGTDLLSAAVKCGITLNTSCGGEGLCGKCKVTIGKNHTKALACQTIVESDLVVTIPKESLEVHGKASHMAENFTKGIALQREDRFNFSPVVRKVFLELPKPSPQDTISDLDRIYTKLEGRINNLHVFAKVGNVKHLSEVLRDSDYKVTATMGYTDDTLEMLSVEPGDTTKSSFGFAFDIGTTTVVGQLIDLNTKAILGTRIAFNKQSRYGSDVISRIIYASQGMETLGTINKAVMSNINEMIEDLARASKVNLGDVYAATFAGNMTMMHLLLKIDPSNIRKAPYVPTTTVFPTIHSAELGVEVNPKGIAAFLPGVSTYVGGDIVAGILACGLYENADTTLLVDIGTNGEIVVGNREWMIAAAASAGPAFEGSGLACGMKAVNGAINKVNIKKALEVEFETIGGSRPCGICGSGYIDLLCQMFKNGIIGKDGKINKDIKSKRIRKGKNVYEFVVAFKKESGTGKDIIIQEDDIENLKRAKGAIYSAIISLLKKVDKDIGSLKKVYIAGGFGNYLDIANAISIGLLPDIDRNVYEFIGNSSLAGARMCLLSHEAFKKAMDIYKNITYIDLSSEPDYMNEYVAALFFPHTDIERFPSVRS